MMRHRLLFSAISLVLLAAPAIAEPPLASRMPSETLLYAGWAGRSLTFDGSLTGQLLAEPGLRELLGSLRGLAMDQLPPGQAELFAGAWDLAGVAWQHPAALTVFDLDIGEQGPVIRGAVLIELGRDREAFATKLDELMQSFAEQVQFTDQTTGAVTYQAAAMPGIQEIAYGYVQETFFFAFGPDAARRIIELSPEVSLATNAEFRQRWQAVGGDNEQLAYYADIARLVESAEKFTGPAATQPGGPPHFRKILNALGLGKAAALAGCTRVVDRGMYTKTRLFSPAPHQGLLMPLAGGTLSEADLAHVPNDADFVAAMKVSPSAVWSEILRGLREVDPQMETQVLQMVAGVEDEMGLSIADDILASLGDTVVVSSAASQGGFMSGTAMTITVKDAEKLAASLAKLEEYLTGKFFGGQDGMFIESYSAGRTDIHYVRGTEGFPLPVAPAWAIYKDKLHIALWPQVISAMVARNGTICPLTAEGSYRQPRAHLGPDASMLSFVNTPQILRRMYPSALMLATMGANALAGNTPMQQARPTWMPDLVTLEKYIWPEMSSVWADEQGITFESYASLPGGGVISAMPTSTPLAVSILLPALHRARQKAHQTISMSNLRQVGLGVLFYNDMKGHYPPSLAAVIEEDLIPTDLLVSPLSGNLPPELIDGELVGPVDYIYVAGLTMEAPLNLLMVYERPEYALNGEVIALFVDGHVQRLSYEEFQEELERTEQWLAEHAQPMTPETPAE